MPAPMEGPFAAKLKAATEGRDFPKVSPDALAMAESLDLSGGGKTGREKRRAKHEKRERGKSKGEGVSGSAVHTRGHFVEAEPVEEAAESPELKEAKRLFGEISAQCDTLGQLNAFMESKGYKDSEGTLSETVSARLERANRTMLPLKEGGVITAAEVGNLTELLEESNQDIADLKEALEGLESAGELTLPPEIKSLFETKPNLSSGESESEVESVNPGQTPVPTEAHLEADNHKHSLAEKRPYASFNADELRALWRKQGALDRINTVTDQLKEWQAFDQTIRKFKDEERFKDDLKARGLGEKYDQVLRLTGRGENIATRLEEIRKAFEERGELDQKEAAFLTAIFFDYHELLAVAERIVAERDRETPIVEAEKAARTKKQTKAEGVVAEAPSILTERVPEKRLSFEDKVVRLKELLDQWEALEQEFGAEPLRQAVRSLRRLEKRGALPPTGKIAKWFTEHDGPNAWRGRAAAADRTLLADDALPGMEAMVKDGRLVAEKLRKEQSERETATPSAPPIVERESEPDPPATSVVTLDRRPVIDGELTEWERMNPVEQNRLRRELFSRKDRFVTGLSERLKRAGVNDADRRNTIIRYLDEYLPQVIKLVVTVPLQDTDREILLRDLKKELAIA